MKVKYFFFCPQDSRQYQTTEVLSWKVKEFGRSQIRSLRYLLSSWLDDRRQKMWRWAFGERPAEDSRLASYLRTFTYVGVRGPNVRPRIRFYKISFHAGNLHSLAWHLREVYFENKTKVIFLHFMMLYNGSPSMQKQAKVC